MGNKALLIFQATLGLGLVCCHYYKINVSTEKYEDLQTGAGEAITEVEGYGPTGPADQSRPALAPAPIEVLADF